MLMHHSQRAARSFVRGLEIRLKSGKQEIGLKQELLGDNCLRGIGTPSAHVRVNDALRTTA